MASYRPKSLDELNSLYDKTLTVKNEIEKKASGFEVKPQKKFVAPVEESPEVQEISREEAASEEIAGLVDDFIKSFGAPVPVKKVQPTSVAAAVKAVSPVRPVEEKKPEETSAAKRSQVNTVYDRPKLIRNSERNDLFEDYKKVMDDEDDFEYGHHRKLRKRGKKLFEKKASSPDADTAEAEESSVIPEAEQESVPVAEAEPEVLQSEEVISQAEPMPFYDIIAEAEDEEAKTSSEVQEDISEEQEPVQEPFETAEDEKETEVAAEDESEPSYIQEEYAEEETAFEEYDAPDSEQEEIQQEIETSPEDVNKKKSAGKNILLVLLLAVMLFASAISAVKAFSGINTDSRFLGTYRFYSAENSYAEAGIKKGDLVVVIHKKVKEGDIFAHKKSEGVYAFSKLDSVLNEESVVADNDGQKTIVFKNSVRGVFYKTYPVVGAIAAFVMANYTYVMGGLIAVAVALAVAVFLAFRKKTEKVEEESYEERESVAETDEEYDAIEGDFRYLIQEDAEDDYDAYRVTDDSSQEEGLPVYQPLGDDYKYEPDEYITK